MELTLGLLAMIWIFRLAKASQNDQSLSFSPPIDSLTRPTPSFWHGTIPSTLLKETLQFQLHLNKLEGLIFYAIDNSYQTLWLEFDKTQLIFKYYNFKNKVVDPFGFDVMTLCSLTELEDVTLNLELSLLGSELRIDCNRKKDKVFYSPSQQITANSNNSKLLETFRSDMKHPVPVFDSIELNNGSFTYIWIGNTPSSIPDDLQRIRIEPLSQNLQGCVQSVKSGKGTIELATTGTRNGNMVEPFCNPVCGTKPCHNKAQCVERWRHNFTCHCGLSKFIGKFCNDTYGVNFDTQMSINIPIEVKLKKFQLAFNHMKTFIRMDAFKVLSIQFIFNQNLYIYIDDKGSLRIIFSVEDKPIFEDQFRGTINHNRTYLFVVEAGINNISFLLADSLYRYEIEKKTISKSLPNLMTLNITVGDSHSNKMKWMKKFNGCISNVILTAGKNVFHWNTIPNFDKLPSCTKKVSNVPVLVTTSWVTESNVALDNVSPISLTNSASRTYIAILLLVSLVVVIAIMLIAIIMFFKYSKLNKKLSNQSEKVQLFEPVIYQHDSVPNSPPIHYKPPYKARSISYSSNMGKSITSLPHTATPTLVTPEDGDC